MHLERALFGFCSIIKLYNERGERNYKQKSNYFWFN